MSSENNGAGNKSLRIRVKKSSGAESPAIWTEQTAKRGEKGLVGRAYSFNYIPYPKKIPISSQKNLNAYKKTFKNTWKEYYNMGSRLQEEKDREHYREYEIATFGHLEPLIPMEKQALIQKYEQEANAELHTLHFVIKPAKVKEILDKYETLLEGISHEKKGVEATEFGEVNLGFLYQSEYDELLESKQQELQTLEQSIQHEYHRIQQEFQEKVARINNYLLLQKVKYNYMRDVVENKILGTTPSSSTVTTTSSSAVTTPTTNNSFPFSTVRAFGEVAETNEQRRERQQKTLKAILAAKKKPANGGSRHTRKSLRKSTKTRKNSRAH
jgi:hypothetical protein